MNYTLLYPPEFDVTPILHALEREGVLAEQVDTRAALVANDVPTVFVLAPECRSDFTGNRLRGFVDSGGAIVAIGTEAEADIPPDLDEDLVAAYVSQPYGTRQLLLSLRTAYREAAARADSVRARQEAAMRTKEIAELTEIGMALSTEHDYEELQGLILSRARELTSSDAASLYLVEKTEGQSPRLRFKLSQTYSRPDIPLVEFTIPIDKKSIAGYVATTNEPLRIDDAYFLAPDAEYTINRSFDKKYGYRTKSMLTIPMADHNEEVIGVLQLINRKRDFEATLETPQDFDAQVVPYSSRVEGLGKALAGQAAVSIENSLLYQEIERLFEGFVRASVHAIEQRDPTTFGHSGRVADKTEALAQAVDRVGSGPYRNVSFTRQELREIKYAGLLHDFGKVGVREEVLVKARKLYEHDLEAVKQRYAFVRRTLERDFYRERVEHLEANGQDGYAAHVDLISRRHDEKIRDLDHFMQLVLDSNQPTVLPEESSEELLQYAEKYFQDLAGDEQPYLTSDDVRFLRIPKGSLDETERLQIESHVTHTYEFLRKIPWTKDMKAIPTIAWGHHEKLDGSGYPRKLKGEDEIPIQTRMMTIADIYDALTAADRPYKKRLRPQHALDIISCEVNEGQIDGGLFEIFVEAEVFKREDEA
ncbi:MAG: GAF domain-containing protein [Gemmatimonadota bacterium]|nr:MAG: GAF domain-containing protein [Gemmatimonadota bacterium]